ncbi:unnamed protein product [Urochloa decumbens]|uniref:DUF6598 domain-containing protein n=1 Tax=Urochloa decumbens TaxID=240449 RepID=A0ABC8WB50_9POAL
MASFNVTSSDAQRFRKFIDELRQTLRVPDQPYVMQRAARLPPQVDNPRMMDITLRANSNEVVLRLRTDNLYVVGFRNARDVWYEFPHGNNRDPMIRDSIALPFDGSYVRGLSPLNESQEILGRPAVIQAIDVLANYYGGSSQASAALRTLIVNFVESIRLNTIADRVDREMRNPSGSRADRQLTTADIGLIRDWGDVSTALRIAANNTDRSLGSGFNPFQNFIAIGINNAFQAAKALGMVLITRRPIVRRFKRAVSDDDGLGLTLVEILGVLIKNIDNEDPGDLYGRVSITDCFGTVVLFNRNKGNTQSVRPGGWADLTWPRRGVAAADDFFIDVNLMDHDSFPDLSPDDEVARGQLFWNSRDTLAREYDAVQRKEVKGEYGSVEVHYVVLTDAVVATVRVVMTDGDGENYPDVYGTITAATRMATGETVQYKLFQKARGEDVPVKKGTAIPLRRNVISAALSSELRVYADLWDADRFPDLSPDDQIALGSVDFSPRLAGCDSREIKGPYGRVTVQVTWSV